MKIQTFVLGRAPTRTWNYNPRRDSCAFTFKRLDDRGMEGTAV